MNTKWYQRSSLRIAVTADLHYGITSSGTIAALVDQIAAAQCDVVLIAGDIGEPDDNFRKALALFERLNIPRAIVAGNHDLWAGQYPSRHLWDDVLPHLARRRGCCWLDADSHVLDGVGICGTIGWYDYSAKDPRLVDYDDSRYACEKARYNCDAIRIDWPTSDREFAAEVLAAFTERLARLQNDPVVKQIIVVTHVPPFAEQIIRKPADDFFWNVNNAYFGNLALGRVIEQFGKVRLVVSGHTHVAVDAVHPCSDTPGARTIRAITVGSQYYQPRLEIIDVDP